MPTAPAGESILWTGTIAPAASCASLRNSTITAAGDGRHMPPGRIWRQSDQPGATHMPQSKAPAGSTVGSPRLLADVISGGSAMASVWNYVADSKPKTIVLRKGRLDDERGAGRHKAIPYPTLACATTASSGRIDVCTWLFAIAFGIAFWIIMLPLLVTVIRRC